LAQSLLQFTQNGRRDSLQKHELFVEENVALESFIDVMSDEIMISFYVLEWKKFYL
jgi:hypothetical protein